MYNLTKMIKNNEQKINWNIIDKNEKSNFFIFILSLFILIVLIKNILLKKNKMFKIAKLNEEILNVILVSNSKKFSINSNI